MVTYRVVFSREAEKDKKKLKAAGLEAKTKSLLRLLAENPFQTPPPYEKLLGDLSDLYSRRINVQHRLVYQIIPDADSEETAIVRVLRMWTHYE